MRTSSADRLGYQRDLADTREGRLLYACIPQIVRAPYGFDTDTQSGLNPTDELGDESIQWKIYAFKSNARDVDTVLMTYGHVPPGVVLGDVLISVKPQDHAMIQEVMLDPNGYFDIDGSFFHPSAINAAGIGWIEEYAVTCKAFSPTYRAPGH